MGVISKRTSELGTENAFVVLGEVGQLLAKGEKIISFCIGQPDFPTPDNICNAAIKAIKDGHHGYTPSPGIPEVREAVARFYTRTRGIQVDTEDVVVGCGGKPFIGYAVLSLTDYNAGHEVIYPNPGFPIYKSQVKAHGAVPVELNLRESKGFVFDLDDLKSKVNDNTRLLILCSPGNPTGGVLSKEELEGIADIVRPYENLWIYSDEVYSALVYDGEFQSISAMPGMQERTIIADSASKTFAMTGWRIGYAANKALAPAFTRWVTNTDSCPAHPNQWAVVEALNGSQEKPLEMRDIFLQRRDKIVAGLNEVPGFHCLNPGGAFYVWPNVTEACKMVGAENSEELRKRLLYEAGVAVLSDVHFGTPVVEDGWHIRFSYASSFEAIEAGLQKLQEFMKKNTR
ncbi:MAG: pyridoxal phosphate-dependent aminotransferase [Acidobacteria bacterium]|uniref:Aminotransferase n=1 Tax=Candidatus Polarisedimenticola svalbardensis TaxID=2886004 RepID=A0A8J7C3P0_9BACT|nr:pyridoxal phosphate-dependent aminotransferase [Candidatus Polarisedimenticola svalbardensis]